MTRWAGRAEQRQAAGNQASRPPGPASRHQQALQTFLLLEPTEHLLPPVPHEVVSRDLRTPRAGLDPSKRSRTLHQEHLEIAGRAVEVTEDEIGVAELHLEQ
jgi:hypothetical protein